MALLVPIDNLLDAPKFVPEIFAPTLESVLAASVFVGRFLTVSVSVFGASVLVPKLIEELAARFGEVVIG